METACFSMAGTEASEYLLRAVSRCIYIQRQQEGICSHDRINIAKLHGRAQEQSRIISQNKRQGQAQLSGMSDGQAAEEE